MTVPVGPRLEPQQGTRRPETTPWAAGVSDGVRSDGEARR